MTDAWHERLCPVCSDIFVPRTNESAGARKQRFCSRKCAAMFGASGGARAAHKALRNRAAAGRPKHGDGPCVCTHCKTAKASDRSALIARVAAEHGVPISTAVALPRTSETMLARGAAMRAGRKRALEVIPWRG